MPESLLILTITKVDKSFYGSLMAIHDSVYCEVGFYLHVTKLDLIGKFYDWLSFTFIFVMIF